MVEYAGFPKDLGEVFDDSFGYPRVIQARDDRVPHAVEGADNKLFIFFKTVRRTTRSAISQAFVIYLSAQKIPLKASIIRAKMPSNRSFETAASFSSGSQQSDATVLSVSKLVMMESRTGAKAVIA